MLILAATPIGNLSDSSARLKQVLASADQIYAEDTRVSRKLLTHLGINRVPKAFHEHSVEKDLQRVRDYLSANQDVAYISDGGMPGISDPGFELVRLALELGQEVDVIPGPCALVNALVLSGLPNHEFCFLGFFPTSEQKKQALIQRLVGLGMTAILYEAPSRIRHTLNFLNQHIPQTRIALCREMTKLHQQVLHGVAIDVLDGLTAEKGEMVLVIEPVAQVTEQGDLKSRYETLIAEGNSPSKAVKILATSSRISKRDVYRQIHQNEG